MPELTLCIVRDAEKDPALFAYCLQALRELNADAMERCQVVVLNQAPTSGDARDLAMSQPFPVEWYDAGYQVVDGVALWDLMASLRELRPRFTGTWLALAHPEFMFSPGSVKTCLDYLADTDAPLVLGNLRRIGSATAISKHKQYSSCKRTSRKVRKALDTGDAGTISEAFAAAKSVSWVAFHDGVADDEGVWREDLFFSRLSWLDAWRFFHHADRLLFQDVYDLIGIAWPAMHKKRVTVPVPRIPLDGSKVLHLWHKKGYVHFTPRVWEWFSARREMWKGTPFIDMALRAEMDAFMADPEAAYRHPLIALRRGVGGTAQRYGVAFKAWLDTEGVTAMRAYMGNHADPEPEVKLPPVERVARKGKAMKIGLIADNNSLRREKTEMGPHLAALAALRKRGHEVQIAIPPSGVRYSRIVDAGLIWNGRHGTRGDTTKAFAAERKPCYVMERGFFKRFHYTQIDPVGFNHYASWGDCLDTPAPEDGAERFKAAWGAKPSPLKRERAGYVLILVQVHGDSQLADSELHHPGPFVLAVENVLPKGVDLRVRAHPLSKWKCGTNGRARMIEGTLADAVAGARFCVTINSNAGNEAMAWGCPVLCLGPSLYGMAGVAKTTRLADLQTTCREMLEGWKPDRQKLTNYLYWLACRQWTADEIAEGWPLEVVGLLEPKERE